MSLDYKNDGASKRSLSRKSCRNIPTSSPNAAASTSRSPSRRARRTSATKVHRLTECDVKSNIKSVPGVMTIRGCAYAGSKGVVWGPVKDMVHISHGPVGCGQYSWSQRRNYYTATTGIDTFVTMQFTSDFQERDIVFGGDKKLDKVINEINALFPLSKASPFSRSARSA